ncbi:MAG: hypothetical protein EAZ97_02735 [Bacteroidetes bacterium]|nr:MAG: hypothetical protein EAZ97_02735 [Bacteroidota bacterium]
MKKMFMIAILPFIMWACGEKKAENQDSKVAVDTTKVQECTYELIKDSARVAWTAFKFTERVGVNGKFDTFMIAGNTSAKTTDEILKSLSMKVLVSSVNTGNPDRDAKIKKEFFGTMASKDTLSGFVKEVGTDSLTISFKMNNIEKDIKAAYKISETEISLISMIDVGMWNASKSIAALNKVCKDVHKGADGKSILHPDVKLSISAAINKICK